jgi:hypothetical protein
MRFQSQSIRETIANSSKLSSRATLCSMLLLFQESIEKVNVIQHHDYTCHVHVEEIKIRFN